MANYANTHFEIYLKESDLNQQLLLENPLSDNIDQIIRLFCVYYSKKNIDKKTLTEM